MTDFDFIKRSSGLETDPMPSADGIARFRDLLGVQICFVGTNYQAAYFDRLQPLGLRPSWVFALGLIAEKPGLSQSELGRGMEFNRASAMALCKNLEAAGLISRTMAEGRKRTQLNLTEIGKQRLDEACEVEDQLTRDVTKDLPKDVFEALTSALRNLSKNLGDLGDETTRL